MMDQYFSNKYLVSYHGNYVGYDRKLKKLIITDFFNENVSPVTYYNNKLIIFIKLLKHYLIYTTDTIEISIDEKMANIDITTFDDYIIIKAEEKYLRCDINKSIGFTANSAREWEFFYPNTYKQIDFGFNKDEFLSINTALITHVNEIPKIIWIYWEQQDRPDLVDKCINRAKSVNPNYDVRVLSKEGLNNYLSVDYINKLFSNSSITPTHRSDVIRLKLLHKYGGVWLDSTTIVNNNFDEIISNEYNFDCIGFYLKQHFQHFQKNKIPVIESWFLAAPKNSQFIELWLQYLEPILKIGSTALLEHFKQRNDFALVKNNFFKLEYFLIYLAQQAVLLDYPNKFNLLVWCADNSALYYHTKFGWGNSQRFAELELFSRDKLTFLPKLIKIARNDRDLIKKLIINKSIRPHSFLAAFI